ncbi:hypothetical protein DRN74_03845 [Candidatus Micrarchaeota archaeon]|nr:MAG: hypothetical protein DRN74_03845 [Candidatus Micrarchaeota archaeon]
MRRGKKIIEGNEYMRTIREMEEKKIAFHKSTATKAIRDEDVLSILKRRVIPELKKKNKVLVYDIGAGISELEGKNHRPTI